MEISIKKPCHENWNDMTPNEKGAFCGKCVKTVIDFSNQSLEEIKAFFTGRETEKICGRFQETQLTSLSFDAFFEKFKRFEFTKRIAVILFFTFGLWLFGASSAMAQNNAQVKGDVQVEEPTLRGNIQVTPVKKDSINCAKPNPDTKIMGKIATVKPPVKPVPVKPVPKNKPMRMGTVSAPPTPKKAEVPKK